MQGWPYVITTSPMMVLTLTEDRSSEIMHLLAVAWHAVKGMQAATEAGNVMTGDVREASAFHTQSLAARAAAASRPGGSPMDAQIGGAPVAPAAEAAATAAGRSAPTGFAGNPPPASPPPTSKMAPPLRDSQESVRCRSLSRQPSLRMIWGR